MTNAVAHAPDEDRVLRAAARLFREHGFAATTVREIAREAGMLPGSLHYRYASKEEILLALMERGVSAATAAVREAVQREPDPMQRLRLGLRAHLKLLLSGDDAVFVLLYDWRSLKGEPRARMVRLRDRYEGLWDGMIREAVGGGRARRPPDVSLLRLFGFGAINWVATWYHPGGPRTPEEIADAFWAVMAFGLLAAPSKKKKRGGSPVRVPSPRP